MSHQTAEDKRKQTPPGSTPFQGVVTGLPSGGLRFAPAPAGHTLHASAPISVTTRSTPASWALTGTAATICRPKATPTRLTPTGNPASSRS